MIYIYFLVIFHIYSVILFLVNTFSFCVYPQLYGLDSISIDLSSTVRISPQLYRFDLSSIDLTPAVRI